jgi:long-subunit acyl-CoA synthetase (AMP-forming)
MKSSDPLLAAWRRTVGRAKDLPAIFNTRGEVVRKFSEIEERARDFETKVEMFNAGSVIAIQIGNHEDWPSILIACLRRRLVVLPLEQSISDQQRDASLHVCRATAVVSAVTSGNSPGLFRLRTADATAEWGEHPPSLL